MSKPRDVEDPQPINIRAHHLLCMQGYQGYGYSPSFVENMTRVIADICSDPDCEVQVTSECDAFCSSCPHAKDGLCQKQPDSADKVKDLDLRVLRKLGLEERTTLGAAEALSLVNARLRKASNVQDLCGNCGWQSKCLWFSSREP